jgi:hypothetical protein
MFTNPFPTPEKTDLDLVIERLFTYQQSHEPNTPEFSQATDQLTILYKLREETSSKKRVSKDTLVQVVGSLVGVVLVLGYEHAHPITSKAFNSVMRSMR